MTRRRFLSLAAGAGTAGALGAGAAWAANANGASPAGPSTALDRKLIIVLFGGGTRSSETVDDPQHRYIPHLWNEIIPAGSLLTNMRVEQKVVHPNSAGSIVTGHWEWDHLDWTVPVAHPTIFELCRKARGAGDTTAWAFVYASILAETGSSLAKGYGREFAANVVMPPTIPRSTAEQMDRRMREAGAEGSQDAQLAAAQACSRLARQSSRIATTHLRSRRAHQFIEGEYETWRAGMGTASHDQFLADRAISCMQTFAPDVMLVAFGEIDCAHYGSWSRYVEAIRRTDALTARIWHAVCELPEYSGKTLMLVLPDHGRELDHDGRWGFVHHSDFYTNEGADEGCRRVWMLALGTGVAAGGRIDRPVPITTAARTALEFLDIDVPGRAEKSVWPHITV